MVTSLSFYAALGYSQVGSVDIGDGRTLTMLKFPTEPVVTLELVHQPSMDPVEIGTGFSHLVVQVDDIAATVQALAQSGLRPGPVEHPAVQPEPRPRGSPTPTATGSN